jgi:DHA2 family multidrug resistance protein
VTAVLANMVQVNHAELAARLTPASAAVRNQMPGLLTGNPQIVAMADRLVSQQAAMLSYLDDFQLMVWISLASVPIVLLLRGGRPKGDAPEKSADDLALERAHSIPE